MATLAVVGGPATIHAYSDRYAGTVVSITDKEIIIQEDIAVRVDGNGISESQEYTYTPNENGRKFIFKRVRSGRCRGEWREGGLTAGYPVTFNCRNKYYDFSF